MTTKKAHKSFKKAKTGSNPTSKKKAKTSPFMPRASVAKLVIAAKSMEHMKDWYERHEEVIKDLFQEDEVLFARILGVTSQSNHVKGNVTQALKAYEQIKKGKLFEGHMPSVASNLENIRYGIPIQGPKIGPFTDALLGDEEAIAVDLHIAGLLFNKKKPSGKAEFEKAKNRVREVAAELGWTPRQVQAALWAFNQVRLGTDPQNVDDYADEMEKRANEIIELRSRLLGGKSGSVSPRRKARSRTEAKAAAGSRAGKGTRGKGKQVSASDKTRRGKSSGGWQKGPRGGEFRIAPNGTKIYRTR